MQRYAALWSGVLTFLMRLHQNPLSEKLKKEYIDDVPFISDCMDRIVHLHAICMEQNAELERNLQEEHDVTEIRSRFRATAEDMFKILNDLSWALIRFSWNNTTAFHSPVIGFAALHTMQKNGNWIQAVDFSSRLSGWIHCMQLFLLGYCMDQIETSPSDSQSDDLENIMRKERNLYLINSRSTPVAELSTWRLMSWTASSDSVRHPITTVNDDCTLVLHRNAEFDVQKWRTSIRQMLIIATTICDEELLFNLNDLPKFSLKQLIDNFVDLRPGHSFLTEPRNALQAIQNSLFDRLHATPNIETQFFRLLHAERLPKQSAINEYLLANQRFLRLISVLMHWTTGLPARRRELTEITWCNQETPRNLYLSHGMMVLITGYHKSQWRIGTRPIARFLPFILGHLLTKYLIYVPPFIQFLQDCVQPSACNRGFLFWENDSPWSVDRFGRLHKTLSFQHMNCHMNTRDYRHIAIALERRLLNGETCHLHGISQHFETRALHATESSDSEHDQIYDENDQGIVSTNSETRLHSWQASHSTQTHQAHYGNDVNLHAGMTDSLLAAYRKVSQQWHHFVVQMPTDNIALTNHKRLTSVDSSTFSSTASKRHQLASRLVVRKQLWTWSAIHIVLQRIFGPDAQPRSLDQRNGLLLIARSHPETIVVMPTGGGKSLLFVIPSLLPRAQVTVVVTPLVALKQDLQRRCMEWRIMCDVYDPFITPHRLHQIPSLLLVDVELAVTDEFLTMTRALHAMDRLDRIVIDEAHLILTAAHYRSHLISLGLLRRLQCPFVCMTATLPPFAESHLRNVLHLTRCETLRASSDRSNLEYRVLTAFEKFNVNSSVIIDQDLIEIAAIICFADVRKWTRNKDCMQRGIVYVQRKSTGQALANKLQCPFYHGDLSAADRALMYAAWSQGSSSPYMVATAAFNAGVDYPSIRRIIHIDAPDGLVNYGQETGRAGRDGLHAVCMTLLSTNWKVGWDSAPTDDFAVQDRAVMTEFLHATTCLRRQITAYLDGGNGVTCDVDQTSSFKSACSVCRLNSSQSFSPSPSPSHAVSSINNDCTQLQENNRTNVAKNPQDLHDDVLQTAASMVRTRAMDSLVEFELYEIRIAAWSDACILCSFALKKRVEGSHDNCLQIEHQEAMIRHRRAVRFDPFSCCYRCGLTQKLCSRRKKEEKCRQPTLAWHASYVTGALDAEGQTMIHNLGGPLLENRTYDSMQWRYHRWLGRSSELFESPTSNMGRLLHYWLDSLEHRCTACN